MEAQRPALRSLSRAEACWRPRGGESAEGAPGGCSARPAPPALDVLRVHKPFGPDGATPRRAVPQRPLLLAAGAHQGAARSERSPRTTGLALSDLSSETLPRFSLLPFVCLCVKGAPARCKVLSRPGVRHPGDGGERGRSELRRLASLRAGKLRGRVWSSRNRSSRRGLSHRRPAEARAGGAGPARP